MPSDHKSSLKNKSMAGIKWMSFYTLGSLVVNVVSTSILARFLSPSEHGMVAAALVLISFANIFGTMGAGPALVYRKHLSEQDIWTAGTLSHIFGLMIYALVFISSDYLESFFAVQGFSNVAEVLGLIFIINSFSVVPEAILQKEMKFKYISVIRLASYSLVYNAVAISLAAFGYGYWSLVYANVISAVVCTVMMCWFFYTRFQYSYRLRMTRESCSNILGYGMGMTISNVISNFALQGDNLTVTKTLGEAAVGVYSKSYQLITYPINVVGKIFDQVFFPMLSAVRDDADQVLEIYHRITKVFALVSIHLSIIIAVCASDIVNIILGPGWDEAIFPIMVFGYSFFFRLTYKVGDLVCKSHGAVYNRALRTTVYAILVVLGSWIGSMWGVGFVAIGVSIAILINYILMTDISLKLIGENWGRYIQKLLPLCMIYLIIHTIASIVYNQLYELNSFLKLIVIGLIVCIVFIILTLTFFRKTLWNEYREIYKLVKQKRRKSSGSTSTTRGPNMH